MMHLLRLGILLVICMLSFSGCVYTRISAPLDTDLNRTELGSKTGKASSYALLWLVAWGDEGIAAAARDGGLKVINHADQEVFSVFFGLYNKHTVVVYGD